ncbi:hypothetical protein GPALN_003389 [Globodera pallida]|nr:hypothetical protein GPALN_003389 [Globodera pallida]
MPMAQSIRFIACQQISHAPTNYRLGGQGRSGTVWRGRFGAASLARPFWRRAVLARAVLARPFWRGQFGAAVWRQTGHAKTAAPKRLAPKRHGAKTAAPNWPRQTGRAKLSGSVK